MTHTKEPWHVDPKASLRVASGEMTVCSCGTTDHIREQWEHNARRIVACVNALEGVPTEWLESFHLSNVRNVAQDLHRVTAQRDELLAALKGVEKRCAFDEYVGTDGQYLKDVRAAIAKVEASK